MGSITDMTAAKPVPLDWRALVWRCVGLALVWLGLNGRAGDSWLIGAPVCVAAAWLSLRLAPASPWRLSLRGALRFIGFFAQESFRGGWDVARRAFHPRLPLAPGIISHPLRLPPGPARLFFCAVTSLLPGTLVVDIEEDILQVHALDASAHTAEELRQLEAAVAALFALRLMERRADRP